MSVTGHVRLAIIAVLLSACSSTGTTAVGGGRATTTSTSVSAVTSTTPEPDEAAVPAAALAQPPSQFPSPNPATCGIERQRVKTGEDTDATSVDQTKIQTTTIAALVTIPAPVQPVDRVAPVEDTVYKLSATLAGFKMETDSDYHLVLADGHGATMIAEIPAPGCVTGGPFKAAIAMSRAAFDARFHPVAGFEKVAVPVTLTGVGFFDRIHGQTGVAPNGIELHPVLSITFG